MSQISRLRHVVLSCAPRLQSRWQSHFQGQARLVGQRILWSLSIAILASYVVAADVQDSKEIQFFEKKIRPVLVQHCYQCHSEDAQRNKKLKGGLLLDSREGMLRGGDSGPAIVPGDPKASLLMKALRYEDGVEMPPAQPLKPSMIADFERWIARGAADPRQGKAPPVQKGIDLEKGRAFWSFQPIQDPLPPKIKNEGFAYSEIDHFIVSKLEERELLPVRLAEPRVLIRRLYLDIVGLPPTPNAVDSFVNAFEKAETLGEKDARKTKIAVIEQCVDQLLESHHFGERWGRHWLDVVRFAESNGKDRNMVWHHAWRYRQWVIDALNRDLPYSDFIRFQIAGDLLPTEDIEERAARTIATGFLALSPKTFEERKREVFLMDMVDEQIDVITRSMLGLSVACARCHDHKFDPIPTRDYYALAGILRSSEPLYGLGPKGTKCLHDTDLQPIGQEDKQLCDVAAQHLQKLRDRTQNRNDARSDRYRVVRRVADAKTQLTKPNADKEKLQADISRMELEIKEWDVKVKALEDEVKQLEANPPPQPQLAMAVRDKAKAEECRIHIRGETTNLGDVAPRGMLQVVSLADVPRIGANESGRKQLADWLVHVDNPLTARVAVNRIWLHLMGKGLVTTPDDFGLNGTRPSHPELLDFLATRFQRDGWSVKKLIRLIVLSRSYQLSSGIDSASQEADSENVLYWRYYPRRLDAETLRDSVLAVSGQLETAPPTSSIVGRLHPFKEPEFNNFALFLKPEQQEHRHRSVYLPIVRGNLPEFLKLFDFPDPSMPIGLREETVVPAQASFLLNSPWMIEQAKRLAENVLKNEHVSDTERIQKLYQRALLRMPNDDEIKQILNYLQRTEDRIVVTTKPAPPVDDPLEKWTSVCQAVLVSSEFRYQF